MFIKLYPQCYAPTQSSLLIHYWLRNGYTAEFTELNYHLDIQAESTFEQKLHYSEKRKLAKCQQQGFEFHLGNLDFLPKAYQTILHNRTQKRKPISLSLEQLQNLFARFPNSFFLACLLDVNNTQAVVSTAVIVKVSSEIIYYFMPADNADYQKLSPSVLLLNYIYDWAKERAFRLLDLGISTEKGAENFGLMRFKQNIGATVSLKTSWYKNFCKKNSHGSFSNISFKTFHTL